MRARTTTSRQWEASSPGASGPPVQSARIQQSRSAPHASGLTNGGAHRSRVGGGDVAGWGGDPGVPGVRRGGGAGDPGGGARRRQRGTIGAPRQQGAHDPAGQGAAPVTWQAREEGLDLLLQQPFHGRAGHTTLRAPLPYPNIDTGGSPCAFGAAETVDNLPANPPPFKPW
jgi:hypothetical protein